MDTVHDDLDAGDVPGQGRTARWTAVAVGVVALLLIGVFALQQFGEETIESNPVIGAVAPPVVGTTIDGDAYDLDRYRGEWVVVNFFATWCIPCIEEHPELVEFTARHVDDGIGVVSVAFDDTPEDIVAFFEDNGGDWPVLPSDTGRIVLDYGVTGVPESYVVAPSGQVVAGFTGVTADQLDAVIAEFEAAAGSPADVDDTTGGGGS
jgi:cytochrome c biogenesis protein CcmG/thiol:disulfide interchange protein DsbE